MKILKIVTVTAFLVAAGSLFPVTASLAAKPDCDADPSHKSCKDDGGGGGSSIRLDAIFNDPDASANFIDEDGGGQYRDGEDGEILIAEGLKFSTVTRNPNDRRVAVTFQGNYCEIRRLGFDGFSLSGKLMNAFFANALSTEFDGCDPGDPFDPEFDNPDLLSCLSSNGTQLAVGKMLLDETRFMSMRVNLTEPGVSLKKSDIAMVLTFAEDLGQNDCGIEDALPVAIKCTDDDVSGACTAWDFKAFRACAFDYEPSHGGNWVWAASACQVSTDISFTLKP